MIYQVKSRGICIEVCPISNQILELCPGITPPDPPSLSLLSLSSLSSLISLLSPLCRLFFYISLQI